MEAFIAHEYSPHVVSVGTAMAFVSACKLMRCGCSKCLLMFTLSGWLAAVFIYLGVRWHIVNADDLSPKKT